MTWESFRRKRRAKDERGASGLGLGGVLFEGSLWFYEHARLTALPIIYKRKRRREAGRGTKCYQLCSDEPRCSSLGRLLKHGQCQAR